MKLEKWPHWTVTTSLADISTFDLTWLSGCGFCGKSSGEREAKRCCRVEMDEEGLAARSLGRIDPGR